MFFSFEDYQFLSYIYIGTGTHGDLENSITGMHRNKYSPVFVIVDKLENNHFFMHDFDVFPSYIKGGRFNINMGMNLLFSDEAHLVPAVVVGVVELQQLGTLQAVHDLNLTFHVPPY